MTTATQRAEAPIERLAVAAFAVPTEAPESDGTLEWDSMTIVTVEADAAGGADSGLHVRGCRGC